MSNLKKEKEKIVLNIIEKIKKSQSLVIVEYKGLTVSDISSLRQKLKDHNIEFKVFKNRLVKLAFKETNFTELEKFLVGQNAFVFSYDDDLLPSKLLYQFSKDNSLLKLKAGTYEGNFLDGVKILELAQLPNRDEILTKLALALMTPLTNLSLSLKLLSEKSG